MAESQTAARPPELPAVRPSVGNNDMLANPQLFEHMQRVAKMFMKSSLIPDHLKKNDGADAFLALQIARDRNESPVAVMQNIFFVSGRAGWITAYMIGRANKSGAFRGRIKWRVEGSGPTLSVTAYATDAESGEELPVTVDMKMAEAEGWTKNAKYKTMPDHMLKWRSAAFLIRLYCPEVMHGMHTVDELEDMAASGHLKDVTPEGHASTADKVSATLRGEEPAQDEPEPEPQPEPEHTPRNWDVHPAKPGEEPKRVAILALLEEAESEADVLDIERHHADFLAKLGRTRFDTRQAFRNRSAELAQQKVATEAA